MSSQVLEANSLSKLKILSIGKDNFVDVMQHHRHRKRHRHLREITSSLKRRIANRYAILLGRQSSMREKKDLSRESKRSCRRRRKKIRKLRH